METIQTTYSDKNAAGFTKEQILTMKAAIKVLAAEQKSLKPQRKTYHFKGERTVEPGVAAWQHMSNRFQIRHMLYAYAIMRGADPMKGLTKKKDTTYLSQPEIENILKQYA